MEEYTVFNKFLNYGHVTVRRNGETIALFHGTECSKLANEYIRFKQSGDNNMINGPPPKKEEPFDPTKEICPYCGLECTEEQSNEHQALYVEVPDYLKERYYLSDEEGGYTQVGAIWQAWHYTCRVNYCLDREKQLKSKGWLRRLIEWVW